MAAAKLRLIQDYEKLNTGLQEQIKLVYPEGYAEYLVYYVNKQGERVTALPFETFDKVYMVRMSSAKAKKLIAEDSDYDNDGNLKTDIREQYEDDYSDIDYLSENNNYDDNW